MKLKLTPDPTFESTVHIHVPGKGPAPVRVTFAYKDAEQCRAMIDKDGGKRTLGQVILEEGLIQGWDLEDECNTQNIGVLFNKYPSSPVSVWRTYMDEVSGARSGN